MSLLMIPDNRLPRAHEKAGVAEIGFDGVGEKFLQLQIGRVFIRRRL